MLEKMIPDAVQVSGNDSDDAKEDKFADFSRGHTRVLITKPKIGAWGLNWQHCAHVVYYPSHSYEQYYQAVRRHWRFGQERPVTFDVVATEGEVEIQKNLQRKADQAAQMFEELVRYMSDAIVINRLEKHTKEVELPSWLF
jgi:SNF2 family DNA or RNA helicase